MSCVCIDLEPSLKNLEFRESNRYVTADERCGGVSGPGRGGDCHFSHTLCCNAAAYALEL